MGCITVSWSGSLVPHILNELKICKKTNQPVAITNNMISHLKIGTIFSTLLLIKILFKISCSSSEILSVVVSLIDLLIDCKKSRYSKICINMNLPLLLILDQETISMTNCGQEIHHAPYTKVGLIESHEELNQPAILMGFDGLSLSSTCAFARAMIKGIESIQLIPYFFFTLVK